MQQLEHKLEEMRSEYQLLKILKFGEKKSGTGL